MGIQGLLSCLKGITYAVDLSEYKGVTAGVDAHCWLHRGTYTCCTELVMGEDTDKYVSFCMGRVKLLQDHGITPIMVFDGASLPIKRAKNNERRMGRKENRERALALYHADRKTEARQHFQKAVDVTPEMARKLIKALQAANVRYLISPYEADAQLAYLSIKGLVDIVITEDSDTIPYGCRKVVFKMDKDGNGQEIDRRNLGANEALPFENWTDDMFLDMCLLAGCDYLTPIAGLGIKTAHKLVKIHRNYKRVLGALDRQRFPVPEGYEKDFYRARMTFRHQRVFDPINKRLTTLHPLKSSHDGEDLSFLGPELPHDLVQAIISGQVNPNTHRPFSPPEVPACLPPPGGQDGTLPEGENRRQALQEEEEEDTRTNIIPSWQRGESAGQQDDAQVLHTSMGKGVYESMNYNPQVELRAQSLQRMDRAISVVTTTSSSTTSKRAAEQGESCLGQQLEQYARGKAQRRPSDSVSTPLLDENTPPLDYSPDHSVEGRKREGHAKGPVPMEADGHDKTNEAQKVGTTTTTTTEPPRWSSYFRTSRASGEESSLERRGLVNDANAVLQRLQQQKDQDRRVETEKRDRRRKRPIASAPWTSRDFHSPIVSDQVETLYRRKKRGGIRDDANNPPISQAQPSAMVASPPPPPPPPRVTRFQPAVSEAQGLNIVEDRADYVKFIPRFNAGQANEWERPPSPMVEDDDVPYYDEDRPSTGIARFGSSHPGSAPTMAMTSMKPPGPPSQQDDTTGVSLFSHDPLPSQQQPAIPPASVPRFAPPQLVQAAPPVPDTTTTTTGSTSSTTTAAGISLFSSSGDVGMCPSWSQSTKTTTAHSTSTSTTSGISRFLTPSYWLGR